MTRMFREKIGHTMEVYIENIVMKSKEEQGHVGNLSDIFEILRRHKLRLNTDKCAFRVGVDKFLRYMITHRGIEVNPNQISAIECLKSPSSLKEV